MRTIDHPRRLLVVGSTDCDIAGLVKRLTGAPPVPDADGSVAGSIHEWAIKTKYYSADVPVWIDEIYDVGAWQEEFTRFEAKEVIEAIGGWIYCFAKSSTGTEVAGNTDPGAAMKAIDTIINKACGYSWEGVKLAVAISSTGKDATYPASRNEELDDLAQECGFEYVDADATGTNEYGERQGVERIVESIEANDWKPTSLSSTDDTLDEHGELNTELWDMKASLLGGSREDDADAEDESFQLDEFESLMSSAQAVKELGAGLPAEERKAVQARAANELLAQVLKSTSIR